MADLRPRRRDTNAATEQSLEIPVPIIRIGAPMHHGRTASTDARRRHSPTAAPSRHATHASRQRNSARQPVADQAPQIPATDERAIAAAVVPTPPPATAVTNVATTGIDARVPGLPMVDMVTIATPLQRWPLETMPLTKVLGLVATEFVRRVHVRALRFLASVVRVVGPNA